MAVVVVAVRVIWRTDVFHLIYVATFGAALNRAIAGDLFKEIGQYFAIK